MENDRDPDQLIINLSEFSLKTVAQKVLGRLLTQSVSSWSPRASTAALLSTILSTHALRRVPCIGSCWCRQLSRSLCGLHLPSDRYPPARSSIAYSRNGERSDSRRRVLNLMSKVLEICGPLVAPSLIEHLFTLTSLERPNGLMKKTIDTVGVIRAILQHPEQ